MMLGYDIYTLNRLGDTISNRMEECYPSGVWGDHDFKAGKEAGYAQALEDVFQYICDLIDETENYTEEEEENED